MDHRLRLLALHGVPRANGHNVLQSLHVHLIRGLALEEIREEALGRRVRVRDGALEGRPCEQDHGFQAHGALLILELGQGAEALGVEVQLQHVQDLVREGAHEGDGVRALLGRGPEDEHRGVVLLAEELERRGVLERVDLILLGELLGERDPQLIEVGDGVLGDLRAAAAAQEEGGFGVLDGLGGLLVERPFGARVSRFST